MKWKNLGIIFNEENLHSIDKKLFYAKSPQALVKENSVIIYFTSRKLDLNKKWISKPYWVEYTKDFSSILNYSSKSILDNGELGTFDEHGIFPFIPIQINNKTYAYITGWSRRKAVDIDMSIGIAKSDDGYNFKRIFNGPVMTASVNEPFLVGDAFVRKYKNLWHMWYIYGDKWNYLDSKIKSETPERAYKIAYAYSNNGIDWVRNNKYIIDQVIENECQALPSVAFHDNKYHMIFCYRNIFNFRNNKENSYKLGYAYSNDLISWVRQDRAIESMLSNDKWDQEMQCYPNFFKVGNKLYCLYNGNQFGKYGFGLTKLE